MRDNIIVSKISELESIKKMFTLWKKFSTTLNVLFSCPSGILNLSLHSRSCHQLFWLMSLSTKYEAIPVFLLPPPISGKLRNPRSHCWRFVSLNVS